MFKLVEMAASVLHEMQMLVIEIQILFDNRPRDYRKELLRLVLGFTVQRFS